MASTLAMAPAAPSLTTTNKWDEKLDFSSFVGGLRNYTQQPKIQMSRGVMKARLIMKREQDLEDIAFSKLDAMCEAKGVDHIYTTRLASGTYRLKRYNKKQMARKAKKIKKLAENEAIFQRAPTREITKISICGGPAPSQQEPLVQRTLNRTPSQKRAVRKPTCHLNASQLASLVTCVSKILRKKGSKIEFVGKKSLKCQFQTWNGSKYLQVHVKHLAGTKEKRDCTLEECQKPLLQAATKVCMRKAIIHTSEVTHGMSGFVLDPAKIRGPIGRYKDNMFIVRGRYNGLLFDARSKVNNDIRFGMTYYSGVDQKFWRGFSTTFVTERKMPTDHVCESNFDVEECGAVAALVCQTIFPCGKITCRRCAINLSQVPATKTLEELAHKFKTLAVAIQQRHKEFTQVEHLAQVINAHFTLNKTNFEVFSEITRLMKDRKEAPATHITALSEIIAKGRLATDEDLAAANTALLEIARYHKNRTENIKGGGLTHFRNKISSKSHINPSLMCDNQLDKNGNFVWGERGYHAKRFFANYFEVVDNARGYDKYALRVNPNGSRKLAIGNLIVSTNFETMREQMKGDPITAVGISNQCISKRGENYVYPCCCVTQEDGTPAISDVRMPTKNHLVLGNSGDHKYLDLPADINAKLYIAKQGYCYVNIFLAMLVNVNESEAKGFTKMVRDVIMDKLGTWPSMMDVATACYLLTVFHPETKNAELPQILVDHASKTMHVLDAYGSITTGYHILKAGTVSQLIQFASDSLDSELKHYVVGGQPAPACEWGSLKLLIRGIYRPRMMQAILHEEPYLMLMSILSPTVIMAMYNSGAFERAVSIWVHQDMRLCDLATTLAALTEKVALAKTLDEQMQILDSHASALLDVTFRGSMPFMSYELGIRTLQRIAARSDTDKTLHEIGFNVLRSKSHHLVEKTFIDLLDTCWSELTYRERFFAIWDSRSWFGKCRKSVVPRDSADSGGKYSISPSALLRSEVARVKKFSATLRQTFSEKLQATQRRITCKVVGMVRYLIPDILKFINMLIIISLLLTIASSCNDMLRVHKQAKQARAEVEFKRKWKALQRLYLAQESKLGKQPTIEEFVEFVQAEDASLLDMAKKLQYDNDVPVIHQAKGPAEAKLEQTIAFVALVMMLFDAERSDCVHKVLMKLKGLTNTITQSVHHQSIDDIAATLEDKNLTVDFEVNVESLPSMSVREHTFAQWWDNQLARNNTIPHYRTEGHFIEFTRQTAAKVAADIAHGPWKDILLRGAVGSGKSTGLPFHLSSKGRVLLLEPTRPLAENVSKQLRHTPFNVSPTLRMRGLSTFGSTPITIMTSGFALHYFAHNPMQLEDFQFIIIDECHVMDSSAMAFRCLLQEYTFGGAIIKVSATPPGREVEFATQYPVKILTEESLSFQQFVTALGTKANSDVLAFGVNILVYVSSYNEVDALSRLLNEKGFKVTKIDGRTMKLGSVEITTHGTSQTPHFVVATNIIENGVTLDVDVVVDFGLKVVPELDVEGRLIRCTKQSISYGERIQRLGRVGRNKPGTALRIGHTEKGLSQIPQSLATEAAFLSFTYGLPVMTHNVSTSMLASCTIQQARTMQQFELSPFYTVNFVRYDGTMHGEVHKLLKQYKLRDSEIVLNRLAIPHRGVSTWLSTREYRKLGANVNGDDEMRIAFYMPNIPDKLHSNMWEVIQKHKGDAGFGRLSGVEASKIAYTLSTDVFAIPRTVKIIDSLIESEMQKQAHFRSITASTCSSTSFSLASISHAIRTKYAKDHTTENISILQGVKSQLLEFQNLSVDPSVQHVVREFGALNCVAFQSESTLANHLGLKGKWNSSLITRDVLVLLGVTVGGIWMAYESFKSQFNEVVCHQGYNKRQRQKLKFRAARDNKREREVYGDDSTITDYFGSAYTAKGKTKGKTKAMGTKTRKFINMYGYNPDDYSFIRFVDPLTGITLDESPYTDISLVQEHFTTIREQELNEGSLDRAAITHRPGIQAYFVKDFSTQALKVDLTPHNPLRVCNKFATIAGFPEREFELRQSGQHTFVDASEIPKKNEETPGDVQHEGKSLFGGMRDYNPIASSICQLTNESDGHCETLYGVGFGSLIITNQHLFKRNNGQLTIRSHHGEFVVKNTTQLQLKPCAGRDIILIRTPKDFPPFPQKLQFRVPTPNERICMVGSNFQEKRVSSTLSEVCATYPIEGSHFWKHWISTKDGHCGLPIVSTRDGCILGLHSLTNYTQTQNYFASVPDNFTSEYLKTQENVEWVRQWKYNTNNVCWGSLKIHDSKPCGAFKITKLVSDLESQDVYAQSVQSTWMMDALKGNLKAVARCPSQLVTKHSVKGKCMLFETYLQVNDSARQFFKPLMGQYQKSKLNREAYIKDIMKYSSPIVVGQVDVTVFEQALDGVIAMLKEKGFHQCNYITDHDDIFTALNMKAAVGALYSGKKRDFFKDYTDEAKESILRDSCRRLYEGKMGIWNGSLKSELRPLEKVNANKTRTFTAAPIDTLLGGKTCVDDFNNQFYDLNLNCPWSVGMTKFHGGWHKLLTMLPDGWLYCDADGSQFDSSLSPYLINAVLRLRMNFMEEWDIGAQMLSNLYTEIVYTPISTPDGTIVKKFKGNNSGQPSTVVDNTLMVIIAMHYTLLKLGIPCSEQSKVCNYFVNGDDLLLALSPEYAQFYNEFEHYFSQLGLNYKFDSRTNNKEDLWFMSHKGVRRGNMFIPKLEKERIVSILEWDRSSEPEHRMEAVCAAMIESWGYDDLTHEIRKFYYWMLEQAPFNELAKDGKAPYLSEVALRNLYTDIRATESELQQYLAAFTEHEDDESDHTVYHQGDNLDAGITPTQKQKTPSQRDESSTPTPPIQSQLARTRDKDVDVGTNGTFSVPRLTKLATKLSLPKVGSRAILNLDHLLNYKPNQVDISNTRATHLQFQTWYEGVKSDYGLTDDAMSILLNGLMVWCIENGTSPNINGVWVMMDGEEQVEYPIKPLIDHAAPTFRQIMAHFSNVAEAYIEKRNFEKPYMPRYGLQRNLTDMSLARYAFDFYELTSRTPVRAKEAHLQMKAAALKNVKTHLFGLDGNVGSKDEDTERHTVEDVNRNMHNLLGMRNM